MINVRNLSYSFGPHLIFDKVYFSIPENFKVGLVGPNGAGKSTLLGLLLGKDTPDDGTIEVLGKIGYVPQEVKHDAILESSETVRVYLNPTNQYRDYELDKMLQGLELGNVFLDQSPKLLSGGQKTKLALARALLMQPDILLLDEPTNFMDISGKKWVMDFLSRYPHTLIVISHDLAMLDRVINKVLFVNPQSQKVEEYTGNYTKYLDLKADKEMLLQRQITRQQKQITRMERGIGKLTTDQVRQRVILQRRIERMKVNLPELPKEIKVMKKISLPDPAPVGEIPIKVTHLSKSYGEKQVLYNLSFYIQRGERVALVGYNGAGKSTLIKIMVGLLHADDGDIVTDSRLQLGYYSQEFETFDLDDDVISNVKEKIKGIPDMQLRSILGRFLISEDKIYQQVKTLSGGEKTRLSIAMLLMQDYNLLVLDEPTTYLDVLSQRVILDALKDYKGAILIVSHTEEFIRELKPDKGILLPDHLVDVWSEKFLQKVEEV